MSDAPRRKRPPEASAPLTKAKVLVAFARTQVPSASHLLRGIEFPLRPPTVPGSIEPLPPEKRTGADYDTEWARRPTARAARRALFEGLIRPTISAVADPEVRGLDRVGHIDGPVIFAANHHSHLDTAVLLSALPGRFRNKVFIAAAADYFFTNRLAGGASALALNAIPIERTKVTRRSADLAADLIADGWSMAIFPEGGRSPDGWGQAFRGGAAYLALRCDVPVIPVHLVGHRPAAAQGGQAAQARQHRGDLRRGPPSRRRRRLASLRRPPRARGRGAGRRGHVRLVVGTAARARRRDPVAQRPGRQRLAPHLGARRARPPPARPQAGRGQDLALTGQGSCVTTVDEPDPDDPEDPGGGWVVLGANTQCDTAVCTFWLSWASGMPPRPSAAATWRISLSVSVWSRPVATHFAWNALRPLTCRSFFCNDEVLGPELQPTTRASAAATTTTRDGRRALVASRRLIDGHANRPTPRARNTSAKMPPWRFRSVIRPPIGAR